MIQGSIVALITPFHKDGSVNFKKLKELLQYHIQSGSDGILILGTTGETSTLSQQECDEIILCSIETVQKKVPLIVGCGCNCTEKTLEQCHHYEQFDIDAYLVITPYYNKTNEDGMIMHFTTIADALSKPLILYNVPGRTGCSISEYAVSILSQHPNIIGIKEASGNISYAMSIARYLSTDFTMYSGNDDIAVAMMAIGAKGIISVFANVFPKQAKQMMDACLQNDYQEAMQLQLQYLTFIHALFMEVNPIPVKAAMNQLGWKVGSYRLPLCPLQKEDHKKLLYIMKTALPTHI